MRFLKADFIMKHENYEYKMHNEYPRLFFRDSNRKYLDDRVCEIPYFLDKLRDNWNARKRFLIENRDVYRLFTSIESLVGGADLYYLTGDAAVLREVLDAVNGIFDMESWVAPVHRPLRFCHVTANITSGIARAFERIAKGLNEEQKESMANKLYEKSVIVFIDCMRKKDCWWTGAVNNWRSMICGEMGTAVLAFKEYIPEYREALRYCIEGIFDVLDNQPEDGSALEGMSYWFPTVGHSVEFAQALYIETEGELNLFEHPYLKKTGYFMICGIQPGHLNFNYFDNSINLNLKSAVTMGILALRQDEPYYCEYYSNMIPSDIESLTAMKEPGKRVSKAQLSGFFPDTNIAVMKSDNTPKATYVGFKSGYNLISHSHLDINSFIINKSGVQLVRDTGTWPYAHYLGFFDTKDRRWRFDANSSLGHNTYLIDNEGQRPKEGIAGKIKKFYTGREYDWLISDGSEAYGDLLQKYDRYLVFIKPDLVILIDSLASDVQREFKQIIHCDGVTSVDKYGASIENNGMKMKLSWIFPSGLSGYVFGQENRNSVYESSNEEREVVMTNRYLFVNNLIKSNKFVMATVFDIFDGSAFFMEQTKSVIEVNENNEIVFEISYKGRKYMIRASDGIDITVK